MILSERELLVMHHVGKGLCTPTELAEAMDVSVTLTYEVIRSLKSKFILDKKATISVAPNPFAIRLMHILTTPDRAMVLSGSALDILSVMKNPVTVDEVSEITGISRSTVFRYIKILKTLSTIRYENGTYSINDLMWKDLRELLRSMDDLHAVMDPRVPAGMTLYASDRERAVFSGRKGGPWTKTAFSVFPDYGVDMLYDTGFYTTYSGEVDFDRAFGDAFEVVETTGDYRQRMLLLMAYLKNEDTLNPPEGFTAIVGRLKLGEKVPNWPSLADAESRVEAGL